MKIINAVKDAINILAILIQASYIYNGGFIVNVLRKEYEPSRNLYVWLPMTGFAVYWVNWIGYADCLEIPYSKLFAKH